MNLHWVSRASDMRSIDVQLFADTYADLQPGQKSLVIFLSDLKNVFSSYSLNYHTGIMSVVMYPRLYYFKSLYVTVNGDGKIRLNGCELSKKSFCRFMRQVNSDQFATLCAYYAIHDIKSFDTQNILLYPEYSVLREIYHVSYPTEPAPTTLEAVAAERAIQNGMHVTEQQQQQQPEMTSVECSGKCGRKTRRPNGTVFTCKRCNLQPIPTFD